MSSPRASTSDFLARNASHASTHKPLPTFDELAALNVPFPRVLIHPRCNPTDFAEVGRDAVVVRNVCGHVAPALPDIVALDHLFGLEEVMVVHHTDCGALRFTDTEVQDVVKARIPDIENIGRMVFGAIVDVEQSVKDDMVLLRNSSIVRQELRDRSSGFVLDIKTGLLSPVEI